MKRSSFIERGVSKYPISLADWIYAGLKQLCNHGHRSRRIAKGFYSCSLCFSAKLVNTCFAKEQCRKNLVCALLEVYGTFALIV